MQKCSSLQEVTTVRVDSSVLLGSVSLASRTKIYEEFPRLQGTLMADSDEAYL